MVSAANGGQEVTAALLMRKPDCGVRATVQPTLQSVALPSTSNVCIPMSAAVALDCVKANFPFSAAIQR